MQRRHREMSKYQTGTPNVPRDMWAFLHRGETVTPAGKGAGREVSVYAPITVTAYSDLDVDTLGYSISDKVLEVLSRELR